MSKMLDKLHMDIQPQSSDPQSTEQTPRRIHPGWLRLAPSLPSAESEPITLVELESRRTTDSVERWMRRRTRHWAVVCRPATNIPKRKGIDMRQVAPTIFPRTVIGGWRRLPDAPLPGGENLHRNRRLDAAGERVLNALLTASPESYGYAIPFWTAALLREELQRSGYRVSIHTVRRALHRLGWEWWQEEQIGTHSSQAPTRASELTDTRLAS